MTFEKPGPKKKSSKIKRTVRLHSTKSGTRCVRCGVEDGTIVPAHYSGFRKHTYGSGTGLKVDDRLTADLCRKCHEYMDGVRTDDIQHSEEFLHLIILTMLSRD
jgi:hypothetical protein